MSRRRVRPVPLVYGVAFLALAVVTLSTRPNDFDLAAMFLWPITLLVMGIASIAALIAHAATRSRRAG